MNLSLNLFCCSILSKRNTLLSKSSIICGILMCSIGTGRSLCMASDGLSAWILDELEPLWHSDDRGEDRGEEGCEMEPEPHRYAAESVWQQRSQSTTRHFTIEVFTCVQMVLWGGRGRLRFIVPFGIKINSGVESSFRFRSRSFCTLSGFIPTKIILILIVWFVYDYQESISSVDMICIRSYAL